MSTRHQAQAVPDFFARYDPPILVGYEPICGLLDKEFQREVWFHPERGDDPEHVQAELASVQRYVLSRGGWLAGQKRPARVREFERSKDLARQVNPRGGR